MVYTEETDVDIKIFVSYSRVDKYFCNEFIAKLQKLFNVWYDGWIKGGQDWEKEIYRRLEWCDIFIYLLSPDSVKSYPCQQELKVILKFKSPVIPILISKNTQIPETLSHLQYIDMSHGLTVDNIGELVAVLMRTGNNLVSPNEKVLERPAPIEEPEITVSDLPVIVHKVKQALKKNEYENVSVILEEIPQDLVPNTDELANLLGIADKAIEATARLKDAKRKFNKDLLRYTNTRNELLNSFEIFSQHILDNGETAQLVRSNGSNDTFQKEDFVPPSSDEELLPMLEWCNIPWGDVYIPSITNGENFGGKTVPVDNFVMSKYPITNAQFDVFLSVEDGYYNPRWWQFSEQAKKWIKTQKEPQPSGFLGDELPRENVSWFEAMAFCKWLSHMLNMKITLPNIAQWQRAAQGGDDRIYPWGDEYRKDHCNTRESGLNKTTPVNKYSKGESVYGVYDMSGNVWEWAIDNVAPNEEKPKYRHAVIGGSFVSPCDRAQIPFRYYLEARTRFSSIGFRVVGLT
jgi:formylglycine-generating enzyme required for sulfatase activity